MNDLNLENILFLNCSSYQYLHRFSEFRHINAKNMTYLNNDVSKMIIALPMISLIDIYGQFKVEDI